MDLSFTSNSLWAHINIFRDISILGIPVNVLVKKILNELILRRDLEVKHARYLMM